VPISIVGLDISCPRAVAPNARRMTRTDVHVMSVCTYKAQADYLQASLGYLLGWPELEQTVGRTPGL
jgi:hypothetical protein